MARDQKKIIYEHLMKRPIRKKISYWYLLEFWVD